MYHSAVLCQMVLNPWHRRFKWRGIWSLTRSRFVRRLLCDSAHSTHDCVRWSPKGLINANAMKEETVAVDT